MKKIILTLMLLIFAKNAFADNYACILLMSNPASANIYQWTYHGPTTSGAYGPVTVDSTGFHSPQQQGTVNDGDMMTLVYTTYTAAWAYDNTTNQETQITTGPYTASIYLNPAGYAAFLALHYNPNGSNAPSACVQDSNCPNTKPGQFYPWPVGTVISANQAASLIQGYSGPECIVPPCTSKETLGDSTGACMAKTCQNGQNVASDGTCTGGCPGASPIEYLGSCYSNCPSGTKQIPTNGAPTCTSVCDTQTQDYVNGACVPKCALGTFRNKWGECTNECPTGQVPDPVTGVCSTGCPSGQTMNSQGQCTPTCTDPTQEQINGKCAPKCSTGESRQTDGTCKNLCTPGSGLVQNAEGQCVKPQCPAGQEFYGTQCIPTTCAVGTHMQDGVCVNNINPTNIDNTPTAGTNTVGTHSTSGTATGGGGAGSGGSGGNNPNGIGGGTGGNANPSDTSVDYSGDTCPAGQVCFNDGICQAGEPDWSADCAGPNYLENRWQTMETAIQSSPIGQLATLGSPSFGGQPVFTIALSQNLGGTQTIDLSKYMQIWQVLGVVVQIIFAWVAIKIIILKKD